MKLTDILIPGFAVAFLIIGVDQGIRVGFSHAYWAFMIALVLFFVHNLRRNRAAAEKPEAPEKSRKTGSSRKGRRTR